MEGGSFGITLVLPGPAASSALQGREQLTKQAAPLQNGRGFRPDWVHSGKKVLKKHQVIYGEGGLPNGRCTFHPMAKPVGFHARKLL